MFKSRPSGEAVRLAAFYGAYFSISGFYTPYWPLVLSERGLAPEEIGLVFGLAMVIRPLIIPAYGYAADRFLGLRAMLVGLTGLMVVAMTGFVFAHDFASILAVTMILMLFWPAILPMAEAIAIRAQMKGRLTYGPVRLWGSVSYVAMNLVGGALIAGFGIGAIYPAMLAAAGSVLLVALWQKPPEPLVGAEAARPTLRELLAALRRPVLLAGLLAAALIDATHVLYYAYGTIHWTKLGYSGGVIGALWSIGVVAEIALMALAGKWIAARPGALFIALGGLGAVVRWTVTAFDPPLFVLFPVQLLHALTYGATLLGFMSLIARHAPARFAGSIQAVFNAVAAGIFSSSLMIASGRLYASLEAVAFLVMAAVAAIGLAGAVFALAVGGRAMTLHPAPAGATPPLPAALTGADRNAEPKR